MVAEKCKKEVGTLIKARKEERRQGGGTRRRKKTLDKRENRWGTWVSVPESAGANFIGRVTENAKVEGVEKAANLGYWNQGTGLMPGVLLANIILGPQLTRF